MRNLYQQSSSTFFKMIDKDYAKFPDSCVGVIKPKLISDHYKVQKIQPLAAEYISELPKALPSIYELQI